MVSNGYVPLDNLVVNDNVIYTKAYNKNGEIICNG